MEKKRCAACGETKEGDAFSKNLHYKDGLERKCRTCRKSAYVSRAHKVCPSCMERKRIQDFVRCASKASGYHAYCKPCFRTRSQAKRAEQLANTILAGGRQCAHCEEVRPASDFTKHTWCRPCLRAAARRRLGDPVKSRKDLSSRLWRSYRMTMPQYEALLMEHGGRCGSCQKPSVKLHVDHDHATNTVRGLLCPLCNRMLGHAKDDPVVLEQGAAYLRRHTSKEQQHGAA